MPKMKTNRGAAKRFKRTGGGKFRYAHSHMNHILTKKRRKRKRQLRPLGVIAPSDEHEISRLLPND